MTYREFLESKIETVPESGFEKNKDDMNRNLFEWQKDIVHWALKRGKAALFEDCGLGKTIQSLEWAESVFHFTKKPVLIICPLAVAEQTKSEGEKFGYTTYIVRNKEEVQNGINITNYEILNHFDVSVFSGVVLDESSILKNYSGKTKNEIISLFQSTPYKLSCTATPAPNDYMELGNQSEFCGIMSRNEMLATYFVHDGGETSKWRLKGHAKDKFWEWIASWAVILTKPSDLGYSDNNYQLPPLNITQQIVKAENNIIDDNYSLFPQIASTLNERRTARRNSLKKRCEIANGIIKQFGNEQCMIWCDLNNEADELKRIIPSSVEVRGTDNPEIKAKRLNGFASGEIQILISKPSIAGYGMNWQNCHNVIFVGLSDSFEMYYQAIRRFWRFGQKEIVNVYIITSEAEGAVKENIERKERQAKKMIKEMVQYTREILKREIKGTSRISISYNPNIKMVIPSWVNSI